MVQFNELRIVNDKLIIDASVKDLSYYENVWISKLVIDNSKTFTPGGPSNNPVYSKTYTSEEEYEPKNIREELTRVNVPGLNDELFFVYIITDGTPSIDTPCGMDNCYTTGAVTNLTKLYNKGISYIKELANSCSIPSGFADFILKYKAFVLSLRACDFLQAIKFWNKFFNNDNVVTTRGCGCYESIGN